MFFRKKNRDEDTKPPVTNAKNTTVEGTAPDVVESPVAATASLGSEKAQLAEETVDARVVAPQTTTLAVAGLSDDDAVRLFPGFERDDFEVGFRSDREYPALMIRWKDGGEWFTVPPIFNRGILAAMDERESSNDLNRLLRNYGYDIDAIQE
ncbi:hypothetical protein [Parvularcula marina]|uniref:Uncharacterized protein n=1 Tax=Parvularcula marina TaxID=2292771 RepID=A0A371RJB4_9PROT|nr:hypothetical protein [Parvularcula marina]RFB05541.1 hypothetical protein DX908_09865 [Parvularcula marina]